MQEAPLTLSPLISEFDLRVRIGDLAKEITESIGPGELVMVGLLKGSFIFMADLARLFHLNQVPLVIDFMSVSSYSGMQSTGTVTLSRDITVDIRGRRVLLIDDILDTGRTLDFAVRSLRARGPAWVKTCVILDKKVTRQVPFEADFRGFDIRDGFVVGYGLDYEGRYREYPFIATVSS